MGAFVTSTSRPTVFQYRPKETAPNLHLPAAWDYDNVLLAAESNAMEDALFDLRNHTRGGINVFEHANDVDIRDGSNAAQTAINAAIAAAAATGQDVVIDVPGTYICTSRVYHNGSNPVRIFLGAGVTIKAHASFAQTALMHFGVTSAGGASTVANVAIFGPGTIDGNNVTRPLRFEDATKVWVQGVVIKNSYSGIVQAYRSTDVTIFGCDVSNSVGGDIFGDGIYFGGCTRARSLYNTVYDFTRIGVVGESDVAVGNEVQCIGTVIYNGHDAQATEHNGGVWIENVNGGLVSGCTISDITNTPGANKTRGIVFHSGATSKSRFTAVDNVVTECHQGILAEISTVVSTVTIRGNTVRKGTLSAYDNAIRIGGAQRIDIDGNFFDDNTQPADQGVIHCAITTATGALHIRNNFIGTMTHVATTADLLIESGGSNITALHLEGLDGWRTQNRTSVAAPETVYVNNSYLKFDTTTYAGLHTTGTMKVSNSKLEHVTGNGASLGFSDSGIRREFVNVTFAGKFVWGNNGAAATINEVLAVGCTYLAGHANVVDGKFSFTYVGCTFIQWDDTGHGSIKGNAAATTLEVRCIGCHWKKGSSTSTPFQVGANGFTVVMIDDSCSTDATSFGQNITAGSYKYGTASHFVNVTAASATLESRDQTVLVNFAGAVALAVPVGRHTIVVKDISNAAGANNITLTPASGTIDGAATNVISTNRGYVTIVGDGTNYHVVT